MRDLCRKWLRCFTARIFLCFFCLPVWSSNWFHTYNLPTFIASPHQNRHFCSRHVQFISIQNGCFSATCKSGLQCLHGLQVLMCLVSSSKLAFVSKLLVTFQPVMKCNSVHLLKYWSWEQFSGSCTLREYFIFHIFHSFLFSATLHL